MKQRLINKKVSPACAYCAVGRISPDKENVLCIRSGVRSLDSSCPKFTYDILKRSPKRMPKLSEYDKKDFEI